MAENTVAAPVQKTLQDISLAKGLSIFLVVVGHILGRGTSEGNDWFITLNSYLHMFRMPFFMALSGYVFFAPGRLERLASGYSRYCRTQAVRLLLPFVFMGVFILSVKLIMARFVHVDNVPESFAAGLWALVWDTGHSPSVFIWYLLSLFVFTVTAPLLFRLIGWNAAVWIGIGAALYALPEVYYAYLYKITPFFLFFVLGGVARQWGDAYTTAIDRWVAAFCLGLLGVLLLKAYAVFDDRIIKLLAGVVSIPALHGLCRILWRRSPTTTRVFCLLGASSYAIYLFNTLAIGVTKAVVFKVTDWHGWHFAYVAPLLLAGGIIGPLLVERCVLLRIPFIRQTILRK